MKSKKKMGSTMPKMPEMPKMPKVEGGAAKRKPIRRAKKPV